jgi:ribonuclease P protein component
MLPIKRRINKDSFTKAMKEGVFVHSTNFYLRLLARKDTKPSLFAFIVPAKIRKTSVGRHLIKRKMSAVIEKTLKDIKEGYSCFIFAKKDVSALPYRNIEAEIMSLLKEVKMLNEKRI